MEIIFEMMERPPESYSRALDREVARSEKPYGYSLPPPPADTGDYDQAALESHCEYRNRKAYE